MMLAVLLCGAVSHPNVLHLLSDDMRPQLGCYGHTQMQTPNLDRLAETGLLFTQAYSNFAYCAPSRNSFMSGRRPDRTRALTFLSTFRDAPGADKWVTMPQFFKNNGYFTSAAGKVYHDHMDDAESWTYPANQTAWVKCGEGDVVSDDPAVSHAFCRMTNESAKQYTDEDLALDEGLKRMELAHASGKPWWVSIGVHRPHTKWRMPAEFSGDTLYPDGTVLPPKFPEAPTGVPFMSGNWNSTADDVEDTAHTCQACTVPSERAVIYRRWYYAAVTYADHMLGKAIDKLKELGVENNTIVVFHSDHGWQLGEVNEWSKKTNSELATRIPLIIRAPWKTGSVGKKTDVRFELVDLYKTVADLAGLPTADVQDSVQGSSVAAVFDAPETKAFDEKAAFSQIGRCGCQMYGQRTVQCGENACARTNLTDPAFNYMGYTMRTAAWRYTEWVSWDYTAQDLLDASWEYPNGRELYSLASDNGTDFDYPGYSTNLAADPQYADVVAKLHGELKAAVQKMK